MKKKRIGKIRLTSGCPRSGTSVEMDMSGAMYGKDMIMYTDHPDLSEEEFDADINPNQQEILDDIKHEGIKTVRKYLMVRNNERFPKRKERQKKKRQNRKENQDMNPKGFYEDARFAVNGIHYMPQFREELHDTFINPKILKVVSQGLLASDPIYIDRIIYMLRHPRAVAKSQERLRGNMPKAESDRLVIHSPQMFINVTLDALWFFKENPDIPIKIIQYEDLMADPLKIAQAIYDFNGLEGDVKAGAAVVDQKLNRSEHQDIECTLWADSEYLHDVMCRIQKLFDKGNRKSINKLIDNAMEYMLQPERETNILQRQWFCLRAKENVSASICEDCMLNPCAVDNYRAQSAAKMAEGVRQWVDEPCLFECGMDVKRKNHVSIQDSIYMNWWRKPEAYPLEEMRALL